MRGMSQTPYFPPTEPGLRLEPHPEQLRGERPDEYLRMLHSISAHGVYLMDRDGIIRSWNPGAENLTGLPASQIIGQPYAALYPAAVASAGVPRRTLEWVRTHRHNREETPRRKADGSEFIAQISLDAMRDGRGELIGFVEVFSDISQARQREEQLYQRVTHDPHSGLPNRHHFTDMLQLDLERARRFAEPLTVAIVSIDPLDDMTELHGREALQRTLQAVIKTAYTTLRKIDALGRLGETEFGIILPRADKQPALEMMRRLQRALDQLRLDIGSHRQISLNNQIGLAPMRPNTRSGGDLLQHAEAALNKARRHSGRRIEVWFE